MKCRWWNRWWHQRMRDADRYMLASLAGLAAARNGEGPEADLETLSAWLVFTDQPGQEHWSCECGRDEQTQIMHMLAGQR